MPEKMSLVIGAAKIAKMILLDENDVAEDLTGITAARLSIKESDLDPTSLFDIDADVMTDVDLATGAITFTISEVNSATLDEGVYVGDVQVEIGSALFTTDRIYFEAVLPIAEVP